MVTYQRIPVSRDVQKYFMGQFRSDHYVPGESRLVRDIKLARKLRR